MDWQRDQVVLEIAVPSTPESVDSLTLLPLPRTAAGRSSAARTSDACARSRPQHRLSTPAVRRSPVKATCAAFSRSLVPGCAKSRQRVVDRRRVAQSEREHHCVLHRQCAAFGESRRRHGRHRRRGRSFHDPGHGAYQVAQAGVHRTDPRVEELGDVGAEIGQLAAMAVSSSASGSPSSGGAQGSAGYNREKRRRAPSFATCPLAARPRPKQDTLDANVASIPGRFRGRRCRIGSRRSSRLTGRSSRPSSRTCG